MDLKTDAAATFFNGLNTHEEIPRDVHKKIKHVLGEIGADVNCGRRPKI
jgi:hypothetical protein